jgi:translation initiation factor 2 subunit 2
MADEDMFDPSLKKKKKKKTVFDPELIGDAEPIKAQPEPAVVDKENIADDKESAQNINIDDDFGALKKKKKKKTTFDLSDVGAALPDDQHGAEDGDKQEALTADDKLDDMDFGMKKKKKKKKPIGDKEDDGFDDVVGDDNVSIQAWEDTDRDYTYDELLKRVFDIMREKNPDMVAGEKKRFVMKPPQVMRVGTKKSSFSNFAEICKMLHRQPKHLLAFLLAELGTSGSIDGNNQLIIKGRFQQKQIESVLRRYIKEYVTCHTCRSPETILQKDTRLYFLQCETCGSRCSVTSIRSGFQAVTGKRAAIRAKTA